MRGRVLVVFGLVLGMAGIAGVARSGGLAGGPIVVSVNSPGVTANAEVNAGTSVTISGELTDTDQVDGYAGCKLDAFYAEDCSSGGLKLGRDSQLLVKPSAGSEAGHLQFFQDFLQSYPAYRPDHVYTVVVKFPIGTPLFCIESCGAKTDQLTGSLQVTIEGAASSGTTVSEPAPGSWSIEDVGGPTCSESFYRSAARVPAVARKASCDTSVGVSASDGNFAKTTIVGVGERTQAQATGEAIATCWLLGPDALPLDNAKLNAYIQSKGGSRATFDRNFASASPQKALVACMQLVTEFLDTSRSTQAAGTAQAQVGGCRAERLALAFDFRGGKLVSTRPAPVTASSIRYRCTTRGGKMAITVAGLNQRAQLGPKLRLGVYRARGAPRIKAKLTFTPGQSTTPAPKAKPGHYAGKDSANNPVSFDVTPDSADVTNLNLAGHVTCTDNSGWTWTITSNANNPISTTLTFTRNYSGGLTINDATYTNLNVTYTLTGTLKATGSASGSFQISHITWDHSGTHYDCTGQAASWTAQLSG